MRIGLITPAARGARAGNRTTAERWARLLRRLGHRVTVTGDYAGEPWDAMVALHGWRSAGAVGKFRRDGQRPLILTLTGTDLYKHLHTDPPVTVGSMAAADRLVALHEAAYRDVPEQFHDKLRVIFQSAAPLPWRRPSRRSFDVCVVGHLREEKDPLRAAYAARELPAASRIRVVHLGKAYSEAWAEAARAETARNPRYAWRGERPHGEVRRQMGRSHLMVLSSRMEGGANVLSEAIVGGLPVVASRISGSVGLLGEAYPGFYPVEDTAALRERMLRAERDEDFRGALERAGAERAPLFTPEREVEAWRRLLEEVS